MIKHTRMRLAVAIAGVIAAVVPSVASASTYDLQPATQSIQDQISATLPYTLTVAGGLLALFIGWKLVKRFTK